MKNFKKGIILSIIIIGALMYVGYNNLNESKEIIEDEVYLENNIEIEENNYIILHITGEVNKPRYYTNK